MVLLGTEMGQFSGPWCVCVCVACMAALPVIELLSSLAMVGAEQNDTFALVGAHNAWCLHWLRWVGSPQWW